MAHQSYLGRYLDAPEIIIRGIIMTVVNVTELNDVEAAEKLYRSLQKVKSSDINDSPFYRVCEWVDKRPNVGNFVKTRGDLIKRIAQDCNMSNGSVSGILGRSSFKLPKNLQARTYKLRKPDKSKVQAPVTPIKPPVVDTVIKGKAEVSHKEYEKGCKEIVVKTSNVEIILRFN